MKYAIVFNCNLAGQRIIEGIARLGRKIKTPEFYVELYGERYVVSFLEDAPDEKYQRNIHPDYVYNTLQEAQAAMPAILRSVNRE